MENKILKAEGWGKKRRRKTERDTIAKVHARDDGLGGLSRGDVSWWSSGCRLQEKTTYRNSPVYFHGVEGKETGPQSLLCFSPQGLDR